MAQWLRVYTALTKDSLSLFPAPILGSSQLPVNSSFREYDFMSTHTIHRIKINILKVRYGLWKVAESLGRLLGMYPLEPTPELPAQSLI